MADTKISALTQLAETPAPTDEFVVVDKSSTTMAASGTDKRITYKDLAGAKVVNVRSYGAVGDATADDTTAINAAIAACLALGSRWTLYFPAGDYKVTSALTSITGAGINNWRICGDGRDITRVFGTHNGPIFTIDVSLGHMYYTTMEHMAIEGSITGTFSSSIGILVNTDTAQDYGLQYATFRSLQLRDTYYGIYIERTKKQVWNAVASVSWHTQFSFENLLIPPPLGSNTLHDGIYAEGPTPQISRFLGGHLRADDNASTGGAAITWGTGGTLEACGDLLVTNVHIVRAKVGIVLKGPLNWASSADGYNQNITILGCQIDNCATNTIQATDIDYFRFGPNNSTTSVGISLTRPGTHGFYQDSSGWTWTGTVNFAGTQNFTGALNITGSSSPVITDANGVRYAQDIVARRTVNTGAAIISGGNLSGAGAQLLLYGGAHATLPDVAAIRGAKHRLQSQNAGTNYFALDDTTLLTIPAAYNATVASLPNMNVDSSGNIKRATTTPLQSSDIGSTVQAYDADLTTLGALGSSARTALGLAIGVNVQAYDADGGLDYLAALVPAADRLPYFDASNSAALATFTAAGRALVDDADAAAQRTTLGLGTAATQTTGTFAQVANNLSDVTASTARTNLGVAIGTNVQAYDAELTTAAGMTAAQATAQATYRNRYVLATSGAQVADKGNVTSAQLFATVTIPAGIIGLNGMVFITMIWSAVGSATKTMEARLAGSPFRYQQMTTQIRAKLAGTFQNRNSQSAQLVGVNTIDSFVGASASSTADLAVNTANSADITFYGTKATGTDTLALEGYTVEVLPTA